MPRRMPTTLRPRFRAQARGGSLLHHAPNRRPRFPRSTPPPGPSAHPSGFSIRSQQDSFGFNPTAHQRLPFVPPLPRSSIPESVTMIPQTGPRRLSENQAKSVPLQTWRYSVPSLHRTITSFAPPLHSSFACFSYSTSSVRTSQTSRLRHTDAETSRSNQTAHLFPASS